MNQEHDKPGIVLEEVSKVYPMAGHAVQALAQVNLRVLPGQVAALIGKSGAGKSTLLHVIGMLDSASQGRVFVNGVDVARMSDRAVSTLRNRSIGFVFQMNNLLPEFSALENVILPGLIAGVARAAATQRAMELLTAVGLSQRAKHRPGELSGGEQQRVAIARALLMAPPILLADEPTGNLDRKTSQAIQDLLLQLCADHQMTMLLVTHDLELAKRLPEQIVMEDGRIMGRGSH